MSKPPVPVRIPIAKLKRAIKALEHQAYMSASAMAAGDKGQNTQAWKDAQDMRRILREQGIRS